VPGLGFDPDTLTFLDSLGPGAAHMTRWQRVVQQAAAQSGVPWLVGSPTWLDVALSDDGYVVSSERFNSAVLLEPDGSVQRYDKVFLTPFGETMPWIRAWPWLEQRLMAVGASGLQFDLQAGRAPVAITIETHDGPQNSRSTVDAPGRTLRLVTPICFEDAVPSVVRALVRDTNADIIVNLSNDGWFGTDDAGRRAHEIAAAFRAVELERPLIRVANTGLTSSIDRYGHVVQRLDARTPGTVLVEPVSSKGSATGYARYGNWFPQLLLLLTVAGVLVRLIERRAACSTEGPTCDVN
jgi:apolipoprotein N-acyltransferase